MTTVSGARSLVLWLLAFVSSLDVCAQTASTGSLTGTVAVKITLRNYGTKETRTAITGQDGLDRFSLLPAGE